MKKILNQWILQFIRRLHKKAEARLKELKKNKSHGTAEYMKIARQERRLRDLKKEVQSRLTPAPAPLKIAAPAPRALGKN